MIRGLNKLTRAFARLLLLLFRSWPQLHARRPAGPDRHICGHDHLHRTRVDHAVVQDSHAGSDPVPTRPAGKGPRGCWGTGSSACSYAGWDTRGKSRDRFWLADAMAPLLSHRLLAQAWCNLKRVLIKFCTPPTPTHTDLLQGRRCCILQRRHDVLLLLSSHPDPTTITPLAPAVKAAYVTAGC